MPVERAALRIAFGESEVVLYQLFVIHGGVWVDGWMDGWMGWMGSVKGDGYALDISALRHGSYIGQWC
jgi:hypothetical protein